jgi:DNA repair exonuclease SbcCD ATPase subunit
MKIEALKIRNFRGIRELEITECASRMLVLGFNRAGKTSLFDAIRGVFIGKLSDAAGKQVRVPEWVGPWAKSANVEIAFTTPGGETMTARMRVTNSVSLEIEVPGRPSWTGPPAEVRGALWEHLGVSQKHRECGMTPRTFLTGDDLGQMVSDLGGGGVDKAKLQEILGEHADWFYDLAALNGITLDSLDSLRAIGAAMFQKRSALNAELKTCRAGIDELACVMPPANAKGAVLTVENIPDVEAAIQKLNRERDTLVEERGAAQAADSAGDIAAELAAAEAMLADLQKKEQALPEHSGLVQALEEATARHKTAARELEAAKKADSNAVYAVQQSDTEKSRAVKLAAQALEAGMACPHCGANVTEKRADKLADKNRAALEAAEAAYTEAAERRDETQAALKKAHEDAGDSLAALEKAEAGLKQAEREAARLLDALDRARSNVNILKAQKPAEYRDIGEIRTDIEKIDARIAAGQNALETLRQLQRREALSSRESELEKAIVRLSWAIPLFHNDGRSNHAAALNELACDEQAAFLAACNERLDMFGCCLGLDTAGKALYVTFGDIESGRHIPLAQVSGAEMLLAEWAVATAFAGDGIVLLDEISRLDGRFRPKLLDAFQAHEGCLWLVSAYTKEAKPDIARVSAALAPAGVVWVGREKR